MDRISLFSDITYLRAPSSDEATLSALSHYFYLGGTKITVINGNDVRLVKENISCYSTVVKVAFYILLFPLTLTLLAIHLHLRHRHQFTVISSSPEKKTAFQNSVDTDSLMSKIISETNTRPKITLSSSLKENNLHLTTPSQQPIIYAEKIDLSQIHKLSEELKQETHIFKKLELITSLMKLSQRALNGHISLDGHIPRSDMVRLLSHYHSAINNLIFDVKDAEIALQRAIKEYDIKKAALKKLYEKTQDIDQIIQKLKLDPFSFTAPYETIIQSISKSMATCQNLITESQEALKKAPEDFREYLQLIVSTFEEFKEGLENESSEFKKQKNIVARQPNPKEFEAINEKIETSLVNLRGLQAKKAFLMTEVMHLKQIADSAMCDL